MLPLSPSQFEFRTLLIVISSVITVLLVAGYIVFQARFLIAGPQIILTEELGVQYNVRTVYLTGLAYNITHLWLNDRQIFTDENGNFSQALVLENGYTIATLKARDRFGRETRVQRPFVYTPVSIVANNL